MEENDPQYRFIRNERFNPNFRDYQKEQFPTNTVKRAGRVTAVDAGTLITKYSTGPGSYIMITRLDIYANGKTEFIVKDRTGTVDLIFLEAAGMRSALGDQMGPVMVLKGTAQFRNLAGTSSGTYSVSIEGIVPQFGSEIIT